MSRTNRKPLPYRVFTSRSRKGRNFKARTIKLVRRATYAVVAEGLDLLAPVAEVAPLRQPVATFSVFRYGDEYIALTGLVPADKWEAYNAAGYLRLPASQCRASDFFDDSYLKWLERNEHWDSYDQHIVGAGELLAQFQTEERQALGLEPHPLAAGVVEA